MNKVVGSFLALGLLCGLGVFNFAVGASRLGKKRFKAWRNYFRMTLGSLLIILSLGLVYFLKTRGII